LTVNSWDCRTKLAKMLPKVGKLISISQPKPWQLPLHLEKYVSDIHGKELTKDAAELLIELTGDELPRLYSEIDKLALFVNDEKVITVNHIESLIGHNRVFGVFEVIDAVIAGDASKAVARLRNMFSEDRAAEYTVVGAFAFHFRRMFEAKTLLEKGVGPDDVAKRLRIWRNKDGFFSQVRKMSLKQIGSILQRLAAMDFEIKTGRTKAEVAVEQLVLNLPFG
jgi:DNA polymerase-3 subunit delta